jgi:hypothetical protein
MKITIFHLGGWKAQGLPKGGFGHVLARKAKKGRTFRPAFFRRFFMSVEKLTPHDKPSPLPHSSTMGEQISHFAHN